MSINSAMLSGVSGLIANSSALAAISDNIANVNTVGYKRTQANFSTLVTSQSKNATYSAGGVKSLTHQFVTQQGLTQSTTSNLDLSIAGAGFFVGTEKPEGLTATDTRSFTRAGSFQLDNLGYLKNDAGLYLQGWLADPVTGDITPDPSDLTQLSSINVGTVGGTAEKTTRAAVNANLRSEQPVSPQVKFVMTKASVVETNPGGTGSYTISYAKTATAGVYDVEVKKGNVLVGKGTGDYSTGTLVGGTGILATDPIDTSGTGAGPDVAFAALGVGTDVDLQTGNIYDPSTNSMSDYALDPLTGVKPDFEIQIPVSDSKGGQRTVTLSLLKGNAPNEWYAELRAKPGDLENYPNGQISSGRVSFTTDGKLSGVGTLFGGTSPTSISIGASDPNFVAPVVVPPAVAPPEAPRWADGLGIDSQSIQIDLANAAGGLTQFNSQSVVQSVNTNGTAFGNLTNIEVDDEGYVSAIFDNGVTRRIAQVAIATFSNANGLKGVNGNAYRVTNESGTYSLKTPGQGGAGSIAPSTLEASTVDLSTEFTGLITTQRAYSASSKIITTADQMLEELLNIKR
jgi:flagellar hook protein FlgE